MRQWVGFFMLCDHKRRLREFINRESSLVIYEIINRYFYILIFQLGAIVKRVQSLVVLSSISNAFYYLLKQKFLFILLSTDCTFVVCTFIGFQIFTEFFIFHFFSMLTQLLIFLTKPVVFGHGCLGSRAFIIKETM